MDTLQDKKLEMQTKLQEGLQILSEASPGDKDKLSLALIKLHGALEDFIRIEIARKSPALRESVQDARQTNWRDLIIHGKQILGFTETDGQIITEANFQRQEVAHGGNYGKDRAELVRYARFVHGWINPNTPLGDLTFRKPTGNTTEDVQSSGGQPIRQNEASPLPRQEYEKPVVHQNTYLPGYRRRWYRSTIFLILTFFLLPPLWAVLIITDRKHGCLLKLMGYSVIIATVLLVYALFPYFDNVWDTFRAEPGEVNIPALPPLDRSSVGSPEPEYQPSEAVASTSIPGTGSSCIVVWVEHDADDLGGMNRSMIWEEIVFERVEESGMTARQFYDLVVKYNPDLVADGYEFKTGKTYLLPQCE